jgi:hypothetical protein
MLWTFLILVQVPIRRFHAAFKGRVVASDFQYGETERVPPDVALPNRTFMNLAEVTPLIFCVICVVLFVTGTVTQLSLSLSLSLTLAWVYLGLRIVHSLVYMTYNHMVHRFAVFATSNFVVLAILVDLALKLPR